jgi:hypothetical protein
MPLCNEQVGYTREAILLAPWLQPGDRVTSDCLNRFKRFLLIPG